MHHFIVSYEVNIVCELARLRYNVLGLTIDMRDCRTGTRTHVGKIALVFPDYVVMGLLLCVAGGFFALMVFQVL